MSSPFTFTNSFWASVVGIALSAMLCNEALAQNAIEKLVAPGELSRLHEKAETICKSCHSSFNKSAQNGLCLECHKDVGSDIVQKIGYHGRAAEVTGAKCRECHAEHKGAEFEMAAFDQMSFDHRLTDYPIIGGHSGVECAECHMANEKYRKAPTNCFSCHGADDPHKEELGRACQSCHSVNNWNEINFDHTRTKFSLLGAHKNAECAACHAGGKFKGVETQCIACHRSDDAHNGAFGTKCEIGRAHV